MLAPQQNLFRAIGCFAGRLPATEHQRIVRLEGNRVFETLGVETALG
jgi:hypothetical protein